MFPGISIGADRLWLSLPLHISLLLYIAFGALVVHVCQRLVERAALMIEHAERKSGFARTSVCVGSLAWALDVAGLFLYRDISAQDARLIPAILALLIMVGSARLTVPALTTTLKPRRVIMAALGLATGMMFAHVALMTSIGKWVGTNRWSVILTSMVLAGSLAGGIAMRHRSAQLRAVKSGFRSLFWFEKLIAGIGILLLHLCLVNAFVVVPNAKPGMGGGLLVLLALVLIGVAFSADQMSNLKAEEKRQWTLNHALTLMRCAHPQVIGDTGHELALIAERLPTLLAPESMQLHFQPICPIQEPNRGIRFEALLRVKDRDLGSIDPELFFLACERMGKTAWADRAVIIHALDCSVPWAQPGIGCCGISVNVAPATLLEPGFVTWLGELLKEKNWPMGWLQLEITEHAMILQARPLAGILERLRHHGVAVVMDDFGAGFSSLTVLADLPIQGIKCDQAFMRGIALDLSRQILLHHICQMGKGLGLSVTVEGVETQVDLTIVREKGAGTAQGYVFARAMPHDKVPTWLESHKTAVDMEFTETLDSMASYLDFPASIYSGPPRPFQND